MDSAAISNLCLIAIFKATTNTTPSLQHTILTTNNIGEQNQAAKPHSNRKAHNQKQTYNYKMAIVSL